MQMKTEFDLEQAYKYSSALEKGNIHLESTLSDIKQTC